jgi:hypothetical protein
MQIFKRNFQSIVRLFTGNAALLVYRERVLTADVNAGLTILPAVPGYKYRLSSMSMIAVGGVTAGLTDARILGTQAGASAALMITTLAALTRSAVNYPGVSGNTVLADGASFDVCDINTAITVGKTGASLTGATAIDFELQYELVPARQGA